MPLIEQAINANLSSVQRLLLDYTITTAATTIGNSELPAQGSSVNNGIQPAHNPHRKLKRSRGANKQRTMILSPVFPISAKVISVGSGSTVGSDQLIRKLLHWLFPKPLCTLCAMVGWRSDCGFRAQEGRKKTKMHHR